MNGWIFIIFGVLLGIGTRWIGTDMAKRKPCRIFFWLRVIVGVPLYLLATSLIYRGFMLL